MTDPPGKRGGRDERPRSEGPVSLFAAATAYMPVVYVATPLTELGAKDRQLLEAWCQIVDDGLISESHSAEHPWDLRLYTPLRVSPPWKRDDRSAEDIWQVNSECVWGDADALIVFSHNGGSIGEGMELAWAIGLGIPVLVLVSPDQKPSRQVAGAASEADVTVGAFRGPEDLRDQVRKWITRKRPRIQAHAFRRELTRQRLLPLATALAVRWSSAGSAARADIALVAGCSGARLDRLVCDLDALGAASASELIQVSAALGVDLSVTLGILRPSLTVTQLRGLQQAALALEWSGPTVAELVILAEAELVAGAAGAARRLPLVSIDDWREFKQSRVG
jgi:hypothetical protein